MSNSKRFWKPKVDRTGAGSAVIRFLPTRPNEEFPFVQFYTHSFQGPNGKWFRANCPTTIGQKCPVCVNNWELRDSGDESLKQLASSRKRKLEYISNILVINDPKHPENNGKVFLFKYGKKIFDKIKDKILPEDADVEPIDPFDINEGCSFILRITRDGGIPRYEESSFDDPSPIGDDDIIAEIDAASYSLDELLKPRYFSTTKPSWM